jgi:hypothetical protein
MVLLPLLSFRLTEKLADEMKEKVKTSFSTFTELEKGELVGTIIPNYQEGLNCDTKFEYHFDSDGKAVAERGIIDIHNSIPFVFSFVQNSKLFL